MSIKIKGIIDSEILHNGISQTLVHSFNSNPYHIKSIKLNGYVNEKGPVLTYTVISEKDKTVSTFNYSSMEEAIVKYNQL